MKQKLYLKETYFSHNGTLYKGDKVLTMYPTGMTKNFVIYTYLSGINKKIEINILKDS